MSITTTMQKPAWSKAKIQQLIDLLSQAVTDGVVASTSGTVTTALSDLASQKLLV